MIYIIDFCFLRQVWGKVLSKALCESAQVGASIDSDACGVKTNRKLIHKIKQFSLTMFVYSSFVMDSHTGQVIPIGNSRSDTAKLEIKYNDGISDLTQNLEFKTH
jgi:hypothetical protein